MANEFIIKHGFHSDGNSQITGSLDISDSLTVNGGAVGAAFPFTGDAQITGSLIISGSFIPRGPGVSHISNVSIGQNAGPDLTSTGQENVIIGNNAGNKLDGEDYTVLIGSSAGRYLQFTNGSQSNVIIGGLAGYNLKGTLGVGADAIDGNVFIGFYAGHGGTFVNTDGVKYNIGIGQKSLEGINGGQGNTTIGYEAGKSISSGDGNIIIGSGSLGSDNPSNQLRIGNGNSFTLISGSLSDGGILIQGQVSASSYIGDGSALTGVGGDAFPFTGDAQITGSLNISGSFNATTIGSSNTTIGSGSGEDLTTGVQNILVGALAGKDNTIGDGNVFIGYEAGETNTLGDYNVAMGYQAGKNLGTGTANDNNVAIGYKAGMGSGYTDANYNVFIGHQAGIDATSGDSNIGLGFNSLFELKGGSNNIALGYQTGVNISSGTKNVMIGYETGFKVTTGANNIFIGEGSNGTKLGGETGTSNQLRIGIDDVVAISASLSTGDVIFANTASSPNFSGSFQGDGSDLTGIALSGISLGLSTVVGSGATSGGSYSNVFGKSASSTGGASVVIGAFASAFSNGIALGQSTRAGSNTVAIGYNAGDDSAPGDYNVLLGYEAGHATTGDYNIILGSGSLGSALDNQLRIGHGNGDVLIQGDFASQSLSINGSGSTVFSVIGSEGTLFSVSDNLTTGSLFSVKDISGIPILDVTANSTIPDVVTVGQSNLLVDSGSLEVVGSISASGDVTGRLQRPTQEFGTNFTASADYSGYYLRTGGNVTCSIQANALPSINSEFDFFQTSSAGNMLFETGSTSVILNSKNNNLNLAGQFSSATLKYVGNNTFDLMGDLT